MFKLFTLLVLAVLLTNYGDAIKCWVCDSEHDKTCEKNEDASKIKLTDCDHAKPGAEMCSTKFNTTEGKKHVVRDCALIKDDMEGASFYSCLKTKDTEVCHCTNDGCNNH